jgi:signal transduction histidine kinase
VKYTDWPDAIQLSASARGGELVIEVADEGCGVPAEALERIFNRFARVDAARSRAKGGVGLGLAIVDAIAKAHGGRCGVRTSSEGSIFSLRLPGYQAAPAVASMRSAVRLSP